MRAVVAVKLSELLDVILVSLVAGVTVTTLFSLVVLSTGRSAQARRAGSSSVATAYIALAVVAFALFAAVVVFGVQVMLSKD